MTRLIAPIFLLSVAVGLGGCSSCSDSGNLRKFPTVSIVSPDDGFGLTRANDTDGDFTNGLQMEVVVNTTALGVGERIKLTAVRKSDRDIQAEVTGLLVAVPGEEDVATVTFADFTPPVGDVEVTATFSFSETARITDSINISVEAINLPTLSIIAPQDSARLTGQDDKDEDLFNGFTTDVTVSAQNIQQGQMVELKVNDVVVGNAELSATGGATFADVHLPEAPEPPGVSITAAASNQAGDKASSTIRVFVDTGRCLVVLTPQPDGDSACDYAGDDDEAPEDSTWVERTFTVESNCDTVSLSINGVLHGDAKDVVDGEVTFLVPLEQVDGSDQYAPRPSNEIRVIANAEDGRFGSAPPVRYVADTIPPVLTVLAPEGNGPDRALISIDDLDPDTDGLQFDVTGTLCNAPADEDITVTVTDSEDATVDVGGVITVLPDVVDGCRNWRASGLTLLLPGDLTVTAEATDDCANAGAAEDTLAADFVVPTLTIRVPDDGRIYLAGDDLDNDPDNGIQAVFTIDVTGLTEGKTIFLERAAVADNGDIAPFASFPDAAEGVIGAGEDPIASAITGTLETGAWRIRARHSGANPATSESIGVRVVLTTPTITIEPLPARTAAASIGVCVTTTDVAPGQPVTLTLNVDDLPQTVDVADDLGACFANVALADGDNVLVASVSDDAGQSAASDPATVHADRTPPQLVFTRPDPADPNLDGDDDQDAQAGNGFQYDIGVDALDADPAVTVTLTARGVPYNAPVLDGSSYTFAAVRLAGGENTLAASAMDSVGNTTEIELVVNVDIDEPETNFVTPRHGDCYSDASNVAIVLESEVADGTEAIVAVNDVPQVPAAINNGRATFNLPLPANQDSTLLGSVAPADGPPGFTAEITVTAKSVAPVLAFADPAADGIINLASADDGPGIAGFQEDVRITAAELSPGQSATLTVNCGDGDTEYVSDAAVDGAFDFADVLVPEGIEGECQASVTSTDCAGNETTEETIWTVDRVAPTLNLEGVENGDRLGSAHDLNPAADGIQRTLVCVTSGVPEGANVTLTMGEEAPLVRQVPANGRAVFSGVDLPEGEAVPITCSAFDAAGNEGSARVVVTVVAGEIELLWISPGGGQIVWGVANDTAPGTDGFQGRFNLATTELANGARVRLCTDNHGGVGDECSRGEGGEFRTAGSAGIAGDRFLLAAVNLRDGDHVIYAEPIIEGAIEVPASPDRTIHVDSARPIVANLTIRSGAHDDGTLNIADDEDDNVPGLQATVLVTLGQGGAGAADGQPVRIVSSFPSPANPTELGAGTVQGGGAQIVVTIPDAVHDSIYAIVTDTAGNQSLSPAANPQNVGLPPVTVDTQAPTLAINKPSEGEVLNSEDDLAAGDAGLQYAARFVVGGASSLAVEVGGVPDDDSPVDDPDGTVDVHVSFGGAQGDAHTLTATASDAAGNTTETSVTITSAPEVPAIAFTAPNSGVLLGEADDVDAGADQVQADVTIAVAAGLAGRTVTVVSDLVAARVDDGAVAVAGDGTATIRVSLQPGQHNLTASITDTFGNTGVSAPIEVNIQSVGCGLVIASPAGNPAPINATTISVRVTSAVPECDGEEVRIRVDDEVALAGTGNLAAGTVTIIGVALGDGDVSHTLTAVVVQNEGEGNESTSQTSKTVQVDTSAPTLTFTDPAPPGGGGALQFAVDVDPADGLQRDFTFAVTGAEGATLIVESDVSGELGRLAELTDAASQTLSDVTVPDGTHTLTARLVDPAGNEGTATQDVVVDTVAPGTPDDVTLTVTNARRLAVTLDWTATGDDAGAGGAVTDIQVRYSATSIDNDDDFEAACDAETGAVAVDPEAQDPAQSASFSGPGPDGACRFRIGGTAAAGTYHIAIRVADDLGNTSEVVNVDADAVAAGVNPVVSVFTETDVPAPAGVTAWGKRVRALGDVNNDGFADIGVGISSENKAFVVYGAADPASATVQEITQADPNSLGEDIGGVGDVNGDGIDDFALLDLYNLYIFLGVDGGQVAAAPSATFGFPNGGADAVTTFDKAGNFDGDTVGDPAVPLNDIFVAAPTQAGASGGAFIIRGRQVWPVGKVTLGITDADDDDNLANGLIRFVGNEAGTFLGYKVCSAGNGGPLVDHDNDGNTPTVPDAYSDVVVATNFAEGGLGVAYLIRGRDLADINGHLSLGSSGVIRVDPIRVDSAGAFGSPCCGGFDLNGDGFDDFTISAEVHRVVEVYSGVDGSHLQTLSGNGAGFGRTVGFGDVDGDGTTDAFVSADPDGDGLAYLHLQSEGSLLAGDPTFTGPNRFGVASDIVGDFTDDGDSDIVLGSPNENRVVVLH